MLNESDDGENMSHLKILKFHESDNSENEALRERVSNLKAHESGDNEQLTQMFQNPLDFLEPRRHLFSLARTGPTVNFALRSKGVRKVRHVLGECS